LQRFTGKERDSESGLDYFGALLLRETDRKMNLLPRFSQCFQDTRNPVFVQHGLQEMLAQRVYGLALGYEDLNDHEQLRNDPLLGLLAGKAQPDKEPLAGKSTLSRMELGDGTPDRYKKIAFQPEAVDVHAHEPETLYVVPIKSDAEHFPLDGKLNVYRSRSGGEEWQPLTSGLPQSNCYVNVLRDAMSVDTLDSCGVYFGTTGGQVYVSPDSGDNWQAIVHDLPAVLSVEVQTLS
jgi:hypothetical protein